MVPVPFIILYLKRFASFLAGKNKAASRFLDLLFEKAKEKAGPVEEFQWLGLMLFVAVPFPGTGAWTGAIVASILDMPFWSAVSANFFGVVLAGLLVNLLVNLGLKYAVVTGIVLFFISTFMWSILRNLKKSLSSSTWHGIGNFDGNSIPLVGQLKMLNLETECNIYRLATCFLCYCIIWLGTQYAVKDLWMLCDIVNIDTHLSLKQVNVASLLSWLTGNRLL